MDLRNRLENLSQQTHELHDVLSVLDRRVAALITGEATLAKLHEAVREQSTVLRATQLSVARLQQELPRVARTEELTRLTRKLDALPFEHLVRSRDITHDKRQF